MPDQTPINPQLPNPTQVTNPTAPTYPTASVTPRPLGSTLPTAGEQWPVSGIYGTTQTIGYVTDPKERAYKDALTDPKVVNEETGKTASRTFTEEEVANLRSSLEPLIVHADINRFHPAVVLAESLLADMGLRFESGHTIPEGHYLDLVHSMVVPDGQYMDPISRTLMPVPVGKRYDRKTATLSVLPVAAMSPSCPHRTDGGYCALCRATSPTLLEGEVVQPETPEAKAERLKREGELHEPTYATAQADDVAGRARR